MSEIQELRKEVKVHIDGVKKDLKNDIGSVKSAVDGMAGEFQKFLVSNADKQARQNGKMDANRMLADSALERAKKAREAAEQAKEKADDAKAYARKVLIWVLAGAALGTGSGVGVSKAAAIAKFFGG